MKIHEDYYFERLEEANFFHFVNMYNAVFDKNVDLSLLKKKYNTSHIIEGYWVYLAFDRTSKEAVASYGVIPWLFQYDNEQVLAAQSTDTMTMKDHRGKGLFGLLHGMVANLLKKNHFKFIFGFPNENSLPVFKQKLHWKFYGNLNYYHYSIPKRVPVRRICNRVWLLKELHDSFVHKVFKNYMKPSFIESRQEKSAITTFKNAAFYHNKQSKSHKIIQINTSFFFIKITNRLVLGDVSFKDKGIFRKDLGELVQLASRSGIDCIDFLCSSGSISDAAFEGSFVKEESLPIGVFELNPSKIPYQKLNFTTIDLDVF